MEYVFVKIINQKPFAVIFNGWFTICFDIQN